MPDTEPMQTDAYVDFIVHLVVREQRAEEIRQVQNRFQATAKKFPGHQKSEVHALDNPSPGWRAYAAVHRFNTTSQLIAWLESEQRQKLITEVKAQFGDDAEVDYPDTLAGFSAWFERPAEPQSTNRPPPTWKQSLIVLVALYPIILILGILVPGLIPTAHPLTTRLLVAAVAVALMGFLVGPGLARLLSPWIHSRRFWPQVGGAAGLIGVLLVIWLASLEIMPGPDDEKSHPSRPLPVDAEHQRNRE